LKRTRGLPALAQAREDRSRGRVRWTTQAGLLAAAVFVGGIVAHSLVSAREMAHEKQALLAKQRAVQVTLGARWFPLRDRLEADVLAAAKPWDGDFVDPEARTLAFRTEPGLYLRMRVADAKDAAAVRRVAADAKRDGFAACLLREPNERGMRGETDGGAFSEQPWNLGQAYAATRILGEDWVHEVQNTDEELHLRALTEQYDEAVRDQIPTAVDVVKRARFFLLVLDEDVPEAAAAADAGPIDEEALQLVAHPARVHLYELPSGKELFRLRRSGEARVIPAGEHVVTDPETRDAMQRQANNCALAGLVERALQQPPAATASAADAGH